MPDPQTEEMRLEQITRSRKELEQAQEADEAADERVHERRAERASYLAEKLEERARSEDAIADESRSGDR